METLYPGCNQIFKKNPEQSNIRYWDPTVVPHFHLTPVYGGYLRAEPAVPGGKTTVPTPRG